MQNTQSNDSTGATQESPEWIHVTINRSSSAPPPVVKQERRSHTPTSDAQRIARNATPTSPAYSGSPKREVAHASMNWTDCADDGCQIHLSKKQGSGWYPQITRRAKKPWKLWKHRSPTSEANSIAPPKSLWQKTTTSNGSIRKKRNSNKPTIDANRCYNPLLFG